MRLVQESEVSRAVAQNSTLEETFDEGVVPVSDDSSRDGLIRRFFVRSGRLLLGTVLATRVDLASVLFILSALFNGFLLRYQIVEDAVYPKAFFSDLAVFSFFAAVGFLFKRKHRPVYYIAFSVFFCLILMFDAAYFRSHNSVLSMFLLPQLQFLPQVSDAMVSLWNWSDVFYIINTSALVVAMAIMMKRGLFEADSETSRSRRRKLTTFLVLTLVIFGSFAAFLSKVEASRITKQWNRPYLVEHFGIYTFHLSDLVKYFGSSPGISEIDKEKYDKVVSFYEARSGSPAPVNSYTGLLKGQNLLFIHAESVQSMFMYREVEGQVLTPNLNRIAQEGLYFDNFYAQQSSGTSSDSEFSLNTSLYPINDGTVFISHFQNTFNTLPKLLKERGYSTLAMHGNHGDFWNRELMNANLGYDRYLSKKDFELDEIIGMGLSDSSFFRQGSQVLDDVDKPFYATMIMLTNHTPFAEVSKYGEFDSGEFEETKMGNYFKSLHYADRAIGELFKDLEERGILDNTTVVIYGDHPANLSRTSTKKFLGLEKLDSYDHRRFKTVPLIIWSKSIEEPRVVHKPMGMIDIMPTVGNMIGMRNPVALGEDIFSVDRHKVAFPDGSWIDDDILYISSTMKYKVFGNDLIKEYKDARCDLAAEQNLAGATGPAADALRCRKISKKRVFKLKNKTSGAPTSLGAYANDRVKNITNELSLDLEISSLILEHDLMKPRSRKHKYSIAHLK